MAKKPSPTNKRGGAQRKTGGQAGGRAGKPSGPVAGTKDKTVRVPSSWKAQTVDPTNQRGGNQRPTGGLAGGRAGRPSGNIARPKPKAPAVKPSGIKSAATVQRGRAILAPRVPTDIFLPNSQVRGTNLPSQGANALSTPRKPPAPKPPKKALPAAGQSGGSQSPKGTTTPKRGGPVRTPAQLAQERRSAAASRKAGAGVGTRASNAAPTTAKGNKPNIVTKGLSKAGSPKGAGAGAVVEFINQLPEELRRARTGYYNLSKPNADRYNNLKNALGGVDPAKYFGTKLSGKGPTTAKPKTKPAGPALKGSMVNGKIQMTQVAKPKKPAAKPAAPKAATALTRSSAPSRSSAPARTPASRPAAKTAAKPKAPASMATESLLSASDIMKGYGMRVNQTFAAESPSTPKKRESLKDQTASIKKMIEESKKRQGKG
jgi:hypothetical protein